MGLKHMAVCDQCRKEEDVEDLRRGWMLVRPVVGNAETYTEIVEAVGRDEKPVDDGMVCSLKCLGEWAFTTLNMRALDEPDILPVATETADGEPNWRELD